MVQGPLSIRQRSCLPLATGLMVAQLVGTLFVWQSNLQIQRQVASVEAAGWLAVPAGPAATALGSIGAALGGGLFFTLTVGAGLALATWALLFIWRWVLGGRPLVLSGLAVLWLAGIAALNVRGAVLWPTLFMVAVPLATALASMLAFGPQIAGDGARRWWPAPLAMALLAGLWSTQFDGAAFSNVRDHLLLSNALGSRVNDFYYRHTHYAAEAFKSLEQKTWRTWQPAADAPALDVRRMGRLLSRYDVLEIADPMAADLVVRFMPRGRIEIIAGGHTTDIEVAAFYADPRRWLRTVSDLTDRYGPFRRLSFAGFLVGFPGLLYVVVYGALRRLTGRWVADGPATGLSAGGCLIFGTLLFLSLVAGKTAPIGVDALETALAGPQWRQRVAALRKITIERRDITGFDAYRELLHSPWVVERYWLARALAYGRDDRAHADLLDLMQDPHPNVVCQAFFALGRRGNPAAIAPIRARMLQSDHWYTQWYGYQALKELGWRQSRSISVR